MENLNDNNFDLNKIEKKNPFTVPEKYFDTFQQKITKKIQQQPVLQPQSKQLVLKPYLAIAASFLLIFFVWQAILKTTQNENATNQIAENEIIEEIGVFDISYFDEELLVSYLTEEQNFENSDLLSDASSEDDLLEYLSVQNIDFDDIEE